MVKGYGSTINFSPDSTLISLTITKDILGRSLLEPDAKYGGLARIWRVDTGKRVETLAGRGGASSVAFSHDSKLVALAFDDKTVRICNVDTGKCVQKTQDYIVDSMAFSHNSALIAMGFRDMTVGIWRVDTGECVQRLQGHSGLLTSVAFSHDSALTASASWDQTLRIWSTETGDCKQVLKVGPDFRSLTFIRNSSHILCGAGTIAIHHTGLSDPAVKMERPGIAISKDRCWIIRDGKHLLWLPVDFRPGCSAVSDSTVIIGSGSGRVTILRLSTG